ncbi:hypothetical protein [Pontibacter diazotrophicus]|nr:hypothetical protein [Pontibacter diazotrophicus]
MIPEKALHLLHLNPDFTRSCFTGCDATCTPIRKKYLLYRV